MPSRLPPPSGQGADYYPQGERGPQGARLGKQSAPEPDPREGAGWTRHPGQLLPGDLGHVGDLVEPVDANLPPAGRRSARTGTG
jgi:hypothetical protein